MLSLAAVNGFFLPVAAREGGRSVAGKVGCGYFIVESFASNREIFFAPPGSRPRVERAAVEEMVEGGGGEKKCEAVVEVVHGKKGEEECLN